MDPGVGPYDLKLRRQARKRLGKRENTANDQALRQCDGHGKYVRLRLLLLLVAVVMVVRAFPPETKRRPMTKERGTWRTYSLLCVVYGPPLCVKSIRFVLSFYAQFNSTTELS